MSTALQPTHGSYRMQSLEHATVADAMHPGIVSCPPEAGVTEVARLMASHHVHCVAVMGIAHEASGDAFVWGLISDHDLIQAGLRSADGDIAATLAREPIVTVTSTTPLREAGELMLARGTSHLVVIDPDRLLPIGILSSLDIAGILAWGEG